MYIKEANLILLSSDFKIELPAKWNREKDREYYTDWYGSNAGYHHALGLIIESTAALETTVGCAIGFLHGGIDPQVLELVETLSFQERIDVLRELVQRVSPPKNLMDWLTQSLAKCQTVETHRSRILPAILGDPENEPWFYELQQLSDWLLTVEIDLRESMEQFEQYERYSQGFRVTHPGSFFSRVLGSSAFDLGTGMLKPQ